MTTTITDSFYLKRLKDCMTKNQYDSVGQSYIGSWLNNKRLEHTSKLTLKDLTFSEMEYKGFQLIVIGWHREIQPIFDKSGKLFDRWGSIEESDIGGYGEVTSDSHFSAYAWEIGTEHDQVQELEWITRYTVLSGICSSNSEKRTLTLAQKKIDTRALVKDAKADLIATSNDRLDWNKKINPYNALVGDQVYIQAFGRMRKGKIVSTTGSRFIVGYVTPSNTNELKYKTLPLSQLWIEG